MDGETSCIQIQLLKPVRSIVFDKQRIGFFTAQAVDYCNWKNGCPSWSHQRCMGPPRIYGNSDQNLQQPRPGFTTTPAHWSGVYVAKRAFLRFVVIFRQNKRPNGAKGSVARWLCRFFFVITADAPRRALGRDELFFSCPNRAGPAFMLQN